MEPSLTNMIGAVTGFLQVADVRTFVNQLECRDCSPRLEQKPGESSESYLYNPFHRSSVCESDDQTYLEGTERSPAFACFRREIESTLSDGRMRGMLRAAMADFLFNYKMSVQYPRFFDPSGYISSAQTLDSRLEPLLVAFNRDMVVFLQHLQGNVGHDSKEGFISNGIVSIRTVSGTDAQVNTTTQNAFKETPPPLAQDFLKQLSAVEKSVPSAEQANLGAQAAAGAMALLNSSQPTTVTLGRDLNLKISPVSLKGASTAELQIHLESKDNGKPQVVSSDGTVKDDTTNRVAQHSIDTDVRVESLKLFEVSSFSAELSRGRKPIPLLPPLVELPYLGSILKYTPKPSTENHRSIAVVSATVLPTAADLLSGIAFDSDRDNSHSPLIEPPISATDVHARMLQCIEWEAFAEVANDERTRLQAEKYRHLTCEGDSSPRQAGLVSIPSKATPSLR